MRMQTVGAVNALTARWARALEPGGNTVFTAAGLWPLLALLADGAAGRARGELEETLGVPAAQAAEAARELLAGFGAVGGLSAALGLWMRAGLPLEERWAAGLPAGTQGRLTGDPATDRAMLDRWAAERTGGLIETMPVADPGRALLVLASALALQVTWRHPFTEHPEQPATGPWAGRRLRRLSRYSARLDRVGVVAGGLTLYQVGGDAGTDVYLVLGTEQAAPGEILARGVAAATRAVRAVPGAQLPEGAAGPGVRVTTVESARPEPVLALSTVAFSVAAEHDLLRQAPLFGLAEAARASTGHFPGVSSHPLAVGEARQSAVAAFHARGFEAAAVTAIAMQPGGAPPPQRHRVRRIDIRFDRPFGFLSVHRASGLVLAAGWVADPEPPGGTAP
ncbi:serpin family protein [Streptomyces sp. NPDC046866]|uniref:serpin family protein n=1 Tax=Streptomyces sp. NPDC046866 TaxID=3154921 RepID=UPI003456A6A9